MAYAVIRTDLMSGVDVAADLVSLRVYNGENKIAVENGVIVELEGYEEGEREVMKAKLATASSPIEKCAIVASVETMYDEHKHGLDKFINEAGAVCRGYIPRMRNMFSLTAEGFVAAPTAVGQTVGIGANGKLDTSKSGFGTIVAIETAGRYTFYVIRIDADRTAA